MTEKIMLVDDNPDLIYMVKRGIKKLNPDYEIVGANSGKECFKFLQRDEKPALILLDIMMPEVDGWSVFAKIKENPEWKDIPIVFLTAKTDAYSKGFGKISAHAYIEKPFEINDLKEKIDKILSGND